MAAVAIMDSTMKEEKVRLGLNQTRTTGWAMARAGLPAVTDAG